MSESIRSIEFAPVEKGPSTRIQVLLAANIPACCGVSDGAYIEFHQEGRHERVELELREDPAGNVLEGMAHFSNPGFYTYRLVARILGAPIFREGTYVIPPTQK